jgi:hypothetical protein
MAKKEPPKQRTPLVLLKPPKPIVEMTDDERAAFANEIFDGLAKTRTPSGAPDQT